MVYLSTDWAQASQSNLLTQHGIIGKQSAPWECSLTVPSCRWSMENCSWDVAPARERGVLHPEFYSTARQTDTRWRTADIRGGLGSRNSSKNSGAVIAASNLEGPRRVDAKRELAQLLAGLTGRPVRMEVVAARILGRLFLRSQGMKNPMPRIPKLDGFNEGWMQFEQMVKLRSRKGERDFWNPFSKC